MRSPAWIAAFVLFAAMPTTLLGAGANPSLNALVEGVESEAARSTALRIERMEIAVRLHGTIAETEVTATFANPTEDNLQGDFLLTMPRSSVVTGYALDVGGRMAEGVIEDQRKARRAYQARVRRNVDPGLGEVLRGNQFRTRVYPIPGKGSRTIRLRFVTPLDPGRGYELPLAGESPVGRVDLSVTATGLAPPAAELPDPAAAEWRRVEEGWRLAWSGRDVELDGELALAMPRPAATLLVSRDARGDRFFEITDSAAGAAPTARTPRRVAILWDRSLSRGDDSIDREIELVAAYLDRVRPEAVDLLLFDSGGVERARLEPAAVAARLRSVRYRGASSVAALRGENLEGADACLLFTDGLVTIDRRDGLRFDCPLFILSSAADADRPWLGALARASGGEVVDLQAGTPEEALGRLTRPSPRIVDVRSAGGAAVDYVSLDAGEKGWRIVGPMPAGGVVVRLAGLEDRVTERVYSAGAGPAPQLAGASALWAADRLAVRAADDDGDRAELLAFARRHSIAGPDFSFIVLETPEDYARAAIEPPPGMPPEEAARYRELRGEIETEERESREGRLAKLLDKWSEQKKWWNARFNPRAKPDPRERADRRDDAGEAVEEVIPPPPPPSPASSSPTSDPGASALPALVAAGEEEFELHQANVPEYPLHNAAVMADQGSRGTIEVEPWQPNRPYLKALDAAAPADRERVLAEQQAKHGALPAFWLDVAEWHFAAGRRGEALPVLLSALDLPTRTGETLQIVADRLVRYGELDRAIYLYERLAAAEPDRPHPLRSLALALAKRSEGRSGDQAVPDLGRAIALLAEVAMSEREAERYEGIELIALMEANRLIPRYRRLGGGEVPLDPRLIALLDVDLRIVIEWNSDDTDLDLWVNEPNGERAYYGNRETMIGGRMSDDQTRGYGPEEYLLRRAPAGTFEVRADIFSADALNPNGPSRVTARLIRDFGRASEREEIVDVELLPERADDGDGDGRDDDDEDVEDEDGDDGVRLIGRITYRR